jgi:hypothetical protein
MKRSQWFAAGIISSLFLIGSICLYSSQSPGDDLLNPQSMDFLLWAGAFFSYFTLCGIYSMTALICFVCGFLEKKEEKK